MISIFAEILIYLDGYFENWVFAVVIFTLVTKVILFPVALWVQSNSITMVRLLPELNRLKIRYYGDKGTIAEEQQKLYKREKYHPIVSTLPMFIQLALLFAVIGAVHAVLDGTDSILAQFPYQVGGATLGMPIVAGCSAYLLGIAQNHISPLQREQKRIEQIGVNAFSILISLALGAFVPVGVGVYWICSNLFTIAQQLLLNAILKPAKRVNYEDLAKSKEELAAIEALSKNESKEDKKREKADYKRFFSVANKHVVFYSEKSGYYKYFRDIIEYLLSRSNVTIHYVTSDSEDQIFNIAAENNRIKAYYIGEKRLITLFMKMDAGIVLMTMPDIDNYHLKRSYVRKDIEYIYVPHWTTSVHMIVRKNALNHFDTVFCVGEHWKNEIRKMEELYQLPRKTLVEYGYGLLGHMRAAYKGIPNREAAQILVAPSHQEGNILESCIDELLESLLNAGFKVIVRPHPQYIRRNPDKIAHFEERWKESFGERLELQKDISSDSSVFESDMVITDWSSIAQEYSYTTLRPSLFVDTPMKVINPDYEELGIEPLDISMRNIIGASIKPEDVQNAASEVKTLFEKKDDFREAISEMVDKYVYNVESAGKVGGDYILQRLVSQNKEKQ